MLRIDINIQ